MSMFRNLLMSLENNPEYRHIEVGDILYNIPVYYTLPDNFYNEMKQWIINTGETANYPRYIFASTFEATNPYNAFSSHDLPNEGFMFYIAENIYVSSPNVFLVGERYGNSQTTIYEYNNGSLWTNRTSFTISNIYSLQPITWIDTSNPAYKYTWVKISDIDKKIPSEYQEVEFIESSGSQYIDTGISGSDLGEYIIKMNPLSRARQWEQYFGGQLYTESTVGKLYENTNKLVYQGYPYARNQFATIGNVNNTDYEIYVINGGIYANGTRLNSYTPVAWGTPSFYIFNSHSEPTLGASMKLYYLKMYSNGVLVRDYVPCYRKSDLEIGLYDLVSGTFFTNEGTGTFYKGPNV